MHRKRKGGYRQASRLAEDAIASQGHRIHVARCSIPGYKIFSEFKNKTLNAFYFNAWFQKEHVAFALFVLHVVRSLLLF